MGNPQIYLTGHIRLQISQHRIGIALDPQNFPCIFYIDLPGLGHAKIMLVSVEELDAKLLLQLNQLLVQSGLRNKQRIRCL